MTSKIADTGFWSANDAHIHHVHCPILADWIANHFEDTDKPLYDFGCGLGNYLKNFQDKGFINTQGFEGDPAAKKVVSNITKQDLTKPFAVPEKGNVLFLEVAEHIPKEFEDQMLENVLNACDENLVTSWAIVGQGGYGHVNCQDNPYVIDKICSYGFEYLEDKTKEVRSINLDKAGWFYNTLFCFKRNAL